MNFLVIEDDPSFLDFLSKNLSNYGKLLHASTLERAEELIQNFKFDCAIVDLEINDEIIGPRIALLCKQRGIRHVIAVTYFENDDALIQQAYQNGVDDFVKKSNLKEKLDIFIKKVVNSKEFRKNVERLTKTTYLTQDKDIIESLEDVCTTFSPMEPIFISGESGVGKTQLAKCLKSLLGIEGELVELNCAGLNDEIIKSELFGHEKGAFTGADRLKMGKVEQANNGILFLDEVGDMPLTTQETILKVIEEKEFTRVGGLKRIRSNFLLVTATLKNLESLVKEGKLRPDFYNRIKGKTIYLRPLRERKDDLKMLIKHFLNQATRSVFVDEQAKEILLQYSWPGNVRELQKFINRLSDVKGGIVTPAHLEKYLQVGRESVAELSKDWLLTENQIDFAKGHQSLSALLDKIKGEFFDFALKEHGGNKNKISKAYQVSRTTLFYHLRDKKISEVDA
ncbi:MAG: sigma 54-interacting transcriptional regulator [Bacteriovoracaceae bacterium]|nr:sigma 54-interacting transcriptional regulator [Bacteriovoracaceae bacterium]